MKISIITPNYNYAKYIGKTIESIVNQDYTDIEHIIVDDGSTDNSIEIIKKYQKKHPGTIKLIQQENKGQTQALNVALSHVTGDIIGWLNSDDTFCENVFKKLIDEFKKEKAVFAVFGDINIIDKKSRIIKKNRYLKFSYISAVFNSFGKEIPSNGIFWRNQDLPLFNESFQYAMDSEYWSRLLVNKKIIKISTLIANFRWHENAKTIKSKRKEDVCYHKVIEERNSIFQQSYKNLFISKLIPIEYSKFIRFYYRSRRLILRGLKGAYFKNNQYET